MCISRGGACINVPSYGDVLVRNLCTGLQLVCDNGLTGPNAHVHGEIKCTEVSVVALFFVPCSLQKRKELEYNVLGSQVLFCSS